MGKSAAPLTDQSLASNRVMFPPDASWRGIFIDLNKEAMLCKGIGLRSERSISRPAADTASGSETPDDAAGSSGRR
jgi:hypothetical protein